MAEGQDFFALTQKSAEGIRAAAPGIRTGREQSSRARGAGQCTLIEQAQALVESDWREAEKLAKEAFDLNPSHPMAKTLRTLILDQKRETFVANAFRRPASCKLPAIWQQPVAVEEALSVLSPGTCG